VGVTPVSNQNLKRTPLFASHQKLGARLVEFGGWEMPVQYTSIVEEHNTVRKAAGIFDISHMGEVFVTGAAAADFLNSLLTNDIAKLSPGQGQYSLMCNHRGGVIDDLYVYCLGLGNYLLIVNASRIEADYAWIQAQHENYARAQSVFISNQSDSYGAVAVQGPKVLQFIDSCFEAEGSPNSTLSALAKNQIQMVPYSGELLYVARTGYTGEHGYEIVAPAHLIEKVWWNCLEKGETSGLKPAGLGARDTLRTEMCYPLYGHELNENTTPIEAGLGYFVALDKPDFNGKSVMAEQKASGPPKKLIAFKMAARSAPPRPDYPIFSTETNSRQLGAISSGTQSPSLNLGIGLGFVPPEFSKPGTRIDIEVRGKKYPGEIVPKPFYKKS
jgi:aminomethyltransferase